MKNAHQGAHAHFMHTFWRKVANLLRKTAKDSIFCEYKKRWFRVVTVGNP
jgi:hypothetical protein